MSSPATLLPPVRDEYERPLEPLGELVLEAPLPLGKRLFAQSWLRKTLIALVLIAGWEIAARAVDNDLLLPTFGATFTAGRPRFLRVGFCRGFGTTATLS